MENIGEANLHLILATLGEQLAAAGASATSS
jgi:hypothetical protein